MLSRFVETDPSFFAVLDDTKADEKDTRDFEKVFCPTGPGGGVDPTCKPGQAGASGAAYTKPTKTVDGYLPGTVGGYAGVSTAQWKQGHPVHQKAMAKIAILEEAASKGDWSTFKKNASKATMEKSSSAILKTILKAQENLLQLQKKEITTLPEPMKAAPAPAAFLVADSSGWKQIGGMLGTEKGGTYTFGGKKYYVKLPDNPDRARNEVFTAKLYKLAGANIPDHQLVEIDGKLAVAREWVEGDKADFSDPFVRVEAQSDFAAHAWLNNRDAIGAGSENPQSNIMMGKDGKLFVLDVGGGLNYRGMGGSGQKPFTAEVEEWASLVNPDVNHTMSDIFGGMPDGKKLASLKKLDDISEADIRTVAEKLGYGGTAEEELVLKNLTTRLTNLRSIRDGLQQKTDAVSGIHQTLHKAAVLESHELPTIEEVSTPFLASIASQGAKDYVEKLKKHALAGDFALVEDAMARNTALSLEGKYAYALWKKMKAKIDPAPVPKLNTDADALVEVSKKIGLPRAEHHRLKWGGIRLLSEKVDQPEITVGAGVDYLKAGQKQEDAWWKEHKEFFSNRSKEVRENIRHYTGSSYEIFNDALRSSLPEFDQHYKEAASVARAVMDSPGYLVPGLVLTRTHRLGKAAMSEVGKLKPGMVVSDKGLLSTTTDDRVAVSDKDVSWFLTVGPGVKGLKVRDYSVHPSENEVILPPNTRLVVQKIEEKERAGQTPPFDKRVVVHAYVLPTMEEQCCPP